MAAEDYIPYGSVEDGWSGREPVTYHWTSLICETYKAWLLLIDGVQFWLPKSQCVLNVKEKRVTLPRWLQTVKGLR